MKNAYLVVDLGTGNSRVALVTTEGKIVGLRNYENEYHRDDAYEDAQYFLPKEWQEKLLAGCLELTKAYPDYKVLAVTSSGARETIVLYDDKREAFYGLPNIDNRGRAWMDEISGKEYIYERSGRWVTEDFPAAKLYGYRKVYPDDYSKITKFTSLSEWIGEIFTGKIVIEPSQACETQLFDIETKKWNQKVCETYDISEEILPEVCNAGTILGKIKPEIAEKLHLNPDAEFVVGGADTQIGVKGCEIEVGDVAVVSGTTSPVVTIVDYAYHDEKERCWTDCNLGGKTWQIETNPGVTGLNYQRLKQNFFADVPYEKLDEEMEKIKEYYCTASFTSLYFSEKRSLKKGGFTMRAPLDILCKPIDFLWALIADIACAIYVQYQSLCEMIPHHKSYILGCGGGFQSRILCQMLADLTGKELIIKEGFEQATINGCMKICNETFGMENVQSSDNKKVYVPRENSLVKRYFDEWLKNREVLNPSMK